MKKILFIIPSLTTGGTNSSLDSYYHFLKIKYDIKVFSISHQPRSNQYSFDEALLPQDLILSLLFSNYNIQKGLFRFFAFFLKIFQRILRMMKIDLIKAYAIHIIKKLEEQRKYDIVIGFQEGNATSIASQFHCPLKIAWIHCNYDAYLPKGMSEEKIYEKFCKIVCVSQYTASVFSCRYPLLKEKTIFIYNLIDPIKIQKQAEQPIDDTRFENNHLILLSVGRFNTVKRFREIPAIASVLKNKGLSFTWYIIGPPDGSDESSLFSERLIQYNVEDCVKWLGGKANPYPYFKTADLYVCLSESEACPMVFKEAKLFALPVVTTDFPSSYEFIHEEEGCITSFEKLSEAITSMIYKIETGFKLKDSYDDREDVLSKVYSIFDDDIHISSINVN